MSRWCQVFVLCKGILVLWCVLLQGSHGLWRSLKVWEKWDKLFKALKVCENWMGSVKVCEFCGLQSAREKISAYQSETAFPKTKQQLNFLIRHAKSQRIHLLSVLTSVSAIGCSKGCPPLLDVWNSCVPSCCFSEPYCKGLWKVCTFWKFFFCMNPGLFLLMLFSSLLWFLAFLLPPCLLD